MKNSTHVVKEANKYLVIRSIIANQPVTIENLVSKTSLSRPTVSNVILSLLNEGLVTKEGYSLPNGGGRPAELISMNDNAYYAIGIDFEFPIVRMALCNAGSKVLASKRYTYNLSDEADYVLERLKEEISELIDEGKVPQYKISGMGIGIPGIIDQEKGLSVRIERINGWKNIRIAEELQEAFHLPVYIENDVHLLALAEKERFVNEKNFLYVAIRSGIGSVAFINNRMQTGLHGNAGFIGHTIIDPNGPLCVCGRKGCLDTYVGELSMSARYRKSDMVSTQREECISLDAFLEREAENDSMAKEILEDAAYYLGIALANESLITDVPLIVINGGSKLKGSGFFKDLEASVRKHTLLMKKDEMELRAGKLTEPEYAKGACYYVLNRAIKKPKLIF